jgi:hypothetical protein
MAAKPNVPNIQKGEPVTGPTVSRQPPVTIVPSREKTFPVPPRRE